MSLAVRFIVDAGHNGLIAIATAMIATVCLRRCIVGMTFQGTDIPTGADVFGADGGKVDSVAAAYPGNEVFVDETTLTDPSRIEGTERRATRGN